MSDVLVTAADLSLGYPGGEVVLRGVSLELRAGEHVVLLGPNGGGKTTLIRALNGELEPAGGSFEIAGAVGHLPQRDATRVDFPVSALDVVLMGTLGERRIWARPRRAERERARAALSAVGLANLAERTFGELSGGQRRRVLLARTIVGRAPIVLLDEPTAGVDPQSSEAIGKALRSISGEGRLVIEASHDIEYARAADRVICLAGRVVADGAPDAVLTDAVLKETYADELTVVHGDGGELLALSGGCGHEHGDEQ
jgi:ABC-type Mn2+/Zn2+ transport system ATPase subunit